MKVTLIIEDSGRGLEISGSGGSFGSLSGAQQYRSTAGSSAPAAEHSAGAYDGGAATSGAGQGSGAAPAPFMGQNVEQFMAVPGSTDVAAGAAPGAAQMNEAMAVEQTAGMYPEAREGGARRRRRAPQRRRVRGTKRPR